MYHCVTVRTNRSKILDRVNFVAVTEFRYGHEMMNVYVAHADCPITLPEH